MISGAPIQPTPQPQAPAPQPQPQSIFDDGSPLQYPQRGMGRRQLNNAAANRKAQTLVRSSSGPTGSLKTLEKLVGADEKVRGGPYTFWCMNKETGFNSNAFADGLKKIASFSTVNGFWSIYKYLIRPNDLRPKRGIDIHCFREGITPVWEDPVNENGGEWVIRMKKGVANRVWEDMLLAIIGGEFGSQGEICGVVMTVKPMEDKLTIWNRNGVDKDIVNGIRDRIVRLVGVPIEMMEYVGHSNKIRQIQMSRDRQAAQQAQNSNQGGRQRKRSGKYDNGSR
eukprot:CAMPEP_0114511138 /NCGR_PEP_ID=MMETSP0109-20121206/14188_1 /TAXON_ID=29199 /ORGANISM="Chlorarachnion reptans, Strain CCCM449" /LENGTH=281 /DNA_ID=CAMNT_0001690547 /DNA_START=22 /DNA_END=867 /DNA_ORIENTATION=+